MAATSSICSIMVHFQVYILISAPENFSEPPRYYRRKQRLKYSKVVINFSQGSAATLSSWGGQINNFCVVSYLSILRAKYCQHM